jgi:hypothetical protein
MKTLRTLLVGGAIAGTALVGGALGASFLGTAGAQTAGTSTTAPAETTAPAAPQSPSPAQGSGSGSGSAPASGQPRQAPDWSKGGHQANGITETVLTGDDAAKATAAAEAAVPGATPQRAETDAEGAAYEVHMTKADGSIVTVKLDSNFAVTQTIDGMG